MLIEDLPVRAQALEQPNGCPRPSRRGPHTSIVSGHGRHRPPALRRRALWVSAEPVSGVVRGRAQSGASPPAWSGDHVRCGAGREIRISPVDVRKRPGSCRMSRQRVSPDGGRAALRSAARAGNRCRPYMENAADTVVCRAAPGRRRQAASESPQERVRPGRRSGGGDELSDRRR